MVSVATSSGAAVSHWSLAAINRVNPGLTPALFSDQDPLADMMTTIGTMGTIQLLTTGTIDDAKIKAYAQVLSEQSPVAVSGADLIEAFRLTRVNPSPFVAAVNESETSAVSLGPLANAEVAVTEPVLADNQWVQLQTICE